MTAMLNWGLNYKAKLVVEVQGALLMTGGSLIIVM